MVFCFDFLNLKKLKAFPKDSSILRRMQLEVEKVMKDCFV